MHVKGFCLVEHTFLNVLYKTLIAFLFYVTLSVEKVVKISKNQKNILKLTLGRRTHFEKLNCIYIIFESIVLYDQ